MALIEQFNAQNPPVVTNEELHKALYLKVVDDVESGAQLKMKRREDNAYAVVGHYNSRTPYKNTFIINPTHILFGFIVLNHGFFAADVPSYPFIEHDMHTQLAVAYNNYEMDIIIPARQTNKGIGTPYQTYWPTAS